jgi:hypothetical protein
MEGIQSLSTWEWWEGFNLRTHSYPLILAIPGFFLKWAELDTNFNIIHSIYFVHCLFLIVGDYYCFHFCRQMIDKKTAICTLVYSFSSEYINNYILRTSANAIEGNLMLMAFYYILNIKPKMFDKALTLLTVTITISFIIRSSSLVGYIPIALMVIYQDFNFILPILVAGLSVAIPLFGANIAIDTYFYGFPTVPQYNFVYWNVLYGISEYFGREPFYYYFDYFNNEFCEIESYGFAVFTLMMVKMMHGKIGSCSGNGWMAKIVGETPGEKILKIPFILGFFCTNLFVLSALKHKEVRFITNILIIG